MRARDRRPSSYQRGPDPRGRTRVVASSRGLGQAVAEVATARSHGQRRQPGPAHCRPHFDLQARRGPWRRPIGVGVEDTSAHQCDDGYPQASRAWTAATSSAICLSQNLSLGGAPHKLKTVVVGFTLVGDPARLPSESRRGRLEKREPCRPQLSHSTQARGLDIGRLMPCCRVAPWMPGGRGAG